MRVPRMIRAAKTGTLLLVIAAVPALSAWSVSAAGTDQPPLTSQPERGVVLDGLEQVPKSVCGTGLRVSGTDLCTHGPDPAPAGVDIRKSVEPVTPDQAKPQAAECNGDGSSGLRTQVIYARASDVADRYAAFLASFRVWAEGADAIYNASAAETGGSRRIRFVHDAACNITVANAVMPVTGDDDFSNTINALSALGFNRTDRKYMIFTDAFVYCGIGTILGDDQPGPDNINVGGPSYGRSDAGCWDAGVIAHEHMHNLGGVQLSAPRTSGGWHCVDEWDLMCYSDSPFFPPMQILCPDGGHDNRFDCNHDDYYSTNPPAGSYLRMRWNAANSLYLTGGGKWGYVWANQPSTASYTPFAAYQRNSSGASNTITRSGVGNYVVRFPNLALAAGTVDVTAYGSANRMCKTSTWGPSGADQVVSVRCFTNTGVPADAMFTASFTGPVQNPGEIGFVWADQPSSASYTPWPSYQFNSTGATNTITRNSLGNYTVRMPGLGTVSAGHVKVTAYGTDSSACKVGNWAESAGARLVNVLCFNAAGAPVDAFYTATYVRNIGVLGVTGATVGYVWADQPSSASYTPWPSYQFNSTGATNTITRSGVGNYTVRMPGLGVANGHVQVTAYGAGAARCIVTTWSVSGSDLLVGVQCANPAGALVDSMFTASYTR